MNGARVLKSTLGLVLIVLLAAGFGGVAHRMEAVWTE